MSNNNFKGIWIDRCLFEKNLNATEILFYCYLYFKSDESNSLKTNLTNKQIAIALKCSPQNVQRTVSSLAKKGFVNVFVDKKNSNCRTIQCKFQYELKA